MSTHPHLLHAAFMAALFLPAVAQTGSPPNAAVHTPTVSVAGSELGSAQVTRSSDTLSVDFPDEDIRSIVRNVADMFELNLVVPETLTGKASIKLREVTWRQIFKVVLEPVGYTFIEDGNIIKIVSNELLTLEPVSTDVFFLNNAKASDIKPTLDGLVDPALGGKIFVDGRSNSLVVTERPSRMARIRTVIDHLDKPTEQVMIESKFVEVLDSDIRNLGVNWASLQGYNLTAGPFDSLTKDSRLRTTTINNPPLVGDGVQHKDELSRISTAVFNAPAFSVMLSALKERTNSKVVSNPTVVTMNNTEAILNIGKEFPIPNYTYNQERGSFEIAGFTYKPIGVILKVTPQVNSQGLIRMTLEPEVSQSSESSNFGSTSIPIISTRKAKTQISLQSGSTVGIGGLLTSTQKHGGTKVPVLGSIPLLGKLFSSKSVNDESNNLLIFITAKTVSASGALPQDVFSASALELTNMSPDELNTHLEAQEAAAKAKR